MHFIIDISTAFYNDFQADSTDLFRFLIESSIPKLWALQGMGKVLAISLRSVNSTFVPSG